MQLESYSSVHHLPHSATSRQPSTKTSPPTPQKVHTPSHKVTDETSVSVDINMSCFLCVSQEYAQLFAALIARTAKDVDVLIDSLPSEESTAALQVHSQTKCFKTGGFDRTRRLFFSFVSSFQLIVYVINAILFLFVSDI